VFVSGWDRGIIWNNNIEEAAKDGDNYPDIQRGLKSYAETIYT